MANVSARVFDFARTQSIINEVLPPVEHMSPKSKSNESKSSNQIGNEGVASVKKSFDKFSNKFDLSFIINHITNKFQKQKQIRLAPAVQNDDFKLGYIVPDAVAYNKCNKLYFEVKNYSYISGKNIADWTAIALRYNILKEHVLFVVTGNGATINKIKKFNEKLIVNGSSDYAFAIHINDLEKIMTPWSNQIETDFNTLKILMSHISN